MLYYLTGNMPSIIAEKQTWYNITGNLTAPIGYRQVATEGETKVFDIPTNIAYGVNGRFLYIPKVQGSVTFNNQAFGGDPEKNVVKGGFAEVTKDTEAAIDTMIKASEVPEVKNSNTLLYVGLGAAVLVTVIVIVMIMRK